MTERVDGGAQRAAAISEHDPAGAVSGSTTASNRFDRTVDTDACRCQRRASRAGVVFLSSAKAADRLRSGGRGDLRFRSHRPEPRRQPGRRNPGTLGPGDPDQLDHLGRRRAQVGPTEQVQRLPRVDLQRLARSARTGCAAPGGSPRPRPTAAAVVRRTPGPPSSPPLDGEADRGEQVAHRPAGQPGGGQPGQPRPDRVTVGESSPRAASPSAPASLQHREPPGAPATAGPVTGLWIAPAQHASRGSRGRVPAGRRVGRPVRSSDVRSGRATEVTRE